MRANFSVQPIPGTNLGLYVYSPADPPAITAEGPTEAETAIVARHWAYLQDLTASGILIFGDRTLITSEDCFASVVFRADSEERARNGYIPMRRISPLECP